MRWCRVADIPANDPVMRLLAQAEAQPDAIAVIDRERQIIYKEFVARVGQLSAAIIGKTTDTPRVMIDVPQGIEAYQSIFAVLMAGGNYSILNPQWPETRQRLVVERFQPNLILTLDVIKWQGTANFRIDLAAPLPVAMPAPRWSDLAYVLFTSGSTGIPKGVEIGRQGLIHYLDWVAEAIAYAPGDRAAQHPNLAFDLSVVDVYGALCGGATLIPFTSLSMRSMPARAIRQLGITVWNSVPSLIDLMQAARQCTAYYLSGLRFANFCGEPFYTRQAKLFREAAPQAIIQNTYGPTEATVSCTALVINDAVLTTDEAVIPLGRPIAGMSVMLEGEQLDEIVIAGPQVARGYIGDIGATAASFMTRTINGVVVPAYRTGDLGEHIDGQLYSRGRIDRQVKLNGYRVELAEVEAAITTIVKGPCYALLHVGQLVIFVQAEELPVSEAFIRQQAAKVLPIYAVPHIIKIIDLLPRNHNDKIDIAALAALLDNDDMIESIEKHDA